VTPSQANDRVQSLGRAFDLLEAMAEAGGIAGVSQLAATSDLPLPTIHRLLRTLVDLGYVRQEPSREYALGPRLIRLGESASRLITNWVEPHLRDLVDEVGESVNLAMLENDHIIYVAQVPGRHSMRMFTEVGRRVGVHCTAVGKAVLASLPLDRATGILRRAGMPAHTRTTITNLIPLFAELERVRERGYATDEQEQEIGVRCVAVVVPETPARAGVSISGPVGRMTDDLIVGALPLLRNVAVRIAQELDLSRSSAGR
jgi:IclR family transcriptional regulator, acetate operon repressor